MNKIKKNIIAVLVLSILLTLWSALGLIATIYIGLYAVSFDLLGKYLKAAYKTYDGDISDNCARFFIGSIAISWFIIIMSIWAYYEIETDIGIVQSLVFLFFSGAYLTFMSASFLPILRDDRKGRRNAKK